MRPQAERILLCFIPTVNLKQQAFMRHKNR